MKFKVLPLGGKLRYELIKYHLSYSALIDPRRWMSSIQFLMAYIRHWRVYLRHHQWLLRLTKISLKDIKDYFKQLEMSKITEHIREQLCQYGDNLYWHPEIFFVSPPLYVICRALQPEVVVETGVANGISTTHILKALEDNAKGTLYSIEPYIYSNNSKQLPTGKQAGWLVPENLQHRWKLIYGKSSEILYCLLNELKSIDISFHDSDHSYENMMFEFKLSWPFIREGGFLIADDVLRNTAFVDFSKNLVRSKLEILWRLVR